MFRSAALFVLLSASVLAAEKAPGPEAILESSIQGLLAQTTKSTDSQALLTFLEEQVAVLFDFSYMSQLVAGPLWRNVNEENKKRFEAEFKKTFLVSLARQVTQLGTPNIRMYPIRPGTSPNEVTVSVSLQSAGGPPTLVDFRLYRADVDWKVFDVVANGNSAVLYYRQWYAERGFR